MSHKSYPAFNYTPLQPGFIRVLRPVIELNGDLTWTMDAFQLGNDEPFDALSYVWGDQSETFPFICNNHEFRIHHNLSNALPYLAKRDSPRPIWIDALCINQRDEDEKATQIRFMYRVYRQATQVWIWFGCATEKTSEAISFLPRLSDILSMMDENFVAPTFQSMGFPSSRDPLWKEVLEISCNEWFERLWVVQEALLARDTRVLRGNQEIAWDTLTKLATNLGNLVTFRDDPLAGHQTEAAGNRETEPKTNLSSFLIDGLSAFLRNDRSALSAYDMPSLLPALQSEKVYELIRMTGALQPDDVMPLWYRYYASIDGNLDILVDDLLSFLLPGRLRRRKPWSNNSYPMPDHLPTDILETLPSELLGDIPTDSLESLPVNSLGALSLSVLDDRPISLWNDRPGSASDDPPISIPDDRLASMTDDPPISLPDDMPKLIGEVLWGVAFDSVSSLSSRDRMPVLNLIAYRLAAGIRDNPAIRDDLELMLQSPSLPYVMQIESRRRLALDAGRWSRPFNLVSMWHLGAGLESCSFQNQASDRTQVALLILEIVWMMTGSQACFDPRDRVFGTFGFFGETLPSEFALSHKMSLEELYSTFCQYLLTESASYPHVELTRWWSTLHRATLAGKRSSLPSWCPDFHQEVDDRYQPFGGAVSSYGIFCQPRFEAGTQLPIMIKRGKDWSEIMLRGRVFDSVSAVHSAIPCVPNLKEVSSGIMGFGTLRMSIYRLAIWERDLAARVVEAPVGSIKPSDMFEVYWQTLVGNRLSGFGSFPSITRQDLLDFQTGLQRIRDLFDRVGVIKRLEDGTLVEEENLWGPSTPEEEDIYQFMTSMESSPYYSVSQAMNHALWDNRPFTTTSGRFGYGRKSMEEGDILCIFDGSTTAHLIRRKKKGRPGAEVYQLVGEAFVHGMMYGEINNLDIEEQDITLI